MANVDSIDSASFPTPQSLLHWLKPRLPPDTVTLWGIKPGTKNVHNLWLELTLGHSTLSNTNPPLHSVQIVVVRIINNNRILHEVEQLLSDGTIRPTLAPLSTKMKPGELPEDAARRAVKEELGSVLSGVEDEREIVRIGSGTFKREESQLISRSYPGLMSKYVIHLVDAYSEGLPEGKFSTEVEEFADGGEFKEVVEKALRVKGRYWIWRGAREDYAAL